MSLRHLLKFLLNNGTHYLCEMKKYDVMYFCNHNFKLSFQGNSWCMCKYVCKGVNRKMCKFYTILLRNEYILHLVFYSFFMYIENEER